MVFITGGRKTQVEPTVTVTSSTIEDFISAEVVQPEKPRRQIDVRIVD
jgi:hypothetical protein